MYYLIGTNFCGYLFLRIPYFQRKCVDLMDNNFYLNTLSLPHTYILIVKQKNENRLNEKIRLLLPKICGYLFLRIAKETYTIV